MRSYFAIVLLLLLSVTNTVRAQDHITINGEVMTADDKQPVPSANISIVGKGIGTAASAGGLFTIILPSANVNDSLRISSLGFKPQTMAIKGLKDGQRLIIILQKTSIQLKEVKIETRDPMKIIQKAIDRIPENYIITPYTTKGFYRNVSTSGKKYLQLSEAVFDIYHFAYADKKEAQFSLIQARDEKNQRDFRTIELGVKPATLFSADKVRNINNNDVLSPDGLKRHDFNVAGMVDYQGRQAYDITFAEKAGIKERGFRGHFYIDTKSFAFVYFDYGLSPASFASYKFGDFSTRLLMKMVGLAIDMKRDNQKVSYQQVNGKWVLQNVVGNGRIYVKGSQAKYDMNVDVKFIYQVTTVDTNTAPPGNKLSSNALIENHDSNDDNFWKGYNIILPDFNTEAVIAGIRAINNENNLKQKFLERERKLPKDPAIRLDSMLAYYHTNNQFNGTALITRKGQVLLSKSYGYADKDKKTLANEHTTYRIGSTAKTFTSVIINQLVAEGKLDMQAPIKTYLPWYVHGDITLEQLITHQSGIPEFFDNNDYKMQIITKSFTLKEMVQKFCSDTLEFTPGTSFNYSNSGFTILALIAEQITVKPFDTLLQERIFTPADMTDTYAGNYKGPENHQATGYGEGGTAEPRYDAHNLLGPGGIWSSAADLLKYHQALTSGKLLPDAQKREMLKPRVEFKDYNAFYDYGWMTDKSAFGVSGAKKIVTYHPGTDLGFFTMYAREEANDSCIILLSNTGDFPRYDMTDLILDALY